MHVPAPSPTPSTAHRPDIDGLRAIAVLAVIGFHITGRVAGGYVGVDAFYVISGYLIGSILVAQLDSGTFSLTQFYVRRIRRILPALTVVLVATTLAGAIVLFPGEFTHYAQTQLAAVLSTSNVYFFETAGYFARPSRGEPLLHTWSLAVEEQFYAAFPVVLLLLHRYAYRGRTLGIAVIAAASFVWSAIDVYARPTAAFYLLHTRGWELLAGVLVALGVFPRITQRWAREALAFSGLGLIAASVLLLTPKTPFPGLAAVPTCLGVVLIIVTGSRNLTTVGRMLSLPPVVFVGLISYSLYLWHWPVITLARHYDGSLDLSHAGKVGALVVTTVLSILSWAFVERPFRRVQATQSTVFRVAIAAVATVAFLSMVVIVGRGFPSRFSPEVLRIASYIDHPYESYFRKEVCFIEKSSFAQFDQGTCLHRIDSNANVLLVGDSFAGHLWYGLSQVLPPVNVMQATAPGCKPTVHPVDSSSPRSCLDLYEFLFGHYLLAYPVDQLILAANWQFVDLPRLAETLDWANAHGIPALLIGPPPQYEVALPSLVAVSKRRGASNLVARNRLEDTGLIDRRLADLAAEKHIRFASIYRLLCDKQDCETFAPNGVILAFDTGHFTEDGSVVVAERLKRAGAFASAAADSDPFTFDGH